MFIYLMAIDDYNDRIKFVTIYENYLQKMQFVAESILNDSSEAENIVHDTFLVIIDNLNKIDEADCHKTWNYIVTILKNRCFNVLKRNKKIVYLDDYTIFNEKIGKTNEEAMIEKESVSCMVELIRNMMNIPMAGTARTGSWCQPIRANVPMVPASEPLITSFNSVYFSH